jgi:hypothetical protein
MIAFGSGHLMWGNTHPGRYAANCATTAQAGSPICLPLFGEIKVNQISFEDCAAALTTKPHTALTCLRSWDQADPAVLRAESQ